MQETSKETFIEWAKKHDWLLFGEGATPNGRQENYLTPAGNVIFITYDLPGKRVATVGFPQPPPPPQGGFPLFGRK